MEHPEKLTAELALQEVQSIKRQSADDEAAHGSEDSLRDWFVMCCAAGMYSIPEMIEIGKIVRSTSEIEFARWYA